MKYYPLKPGRINVRVKFIGTVDIGKEGMVFKVRSGATQRVLVGRDTKTVPSSFLVQLEA